MADSFRSDGSWVKYMRALVKEDKEHLEEPTRKVAIRTPAEELSGLGQMEYLFLCPVGIREGNSTPEFGAGFEWAGL